MVRRAALEVLGALAPSLDKRLEAARQSISSDEERRFLTHLVYGVVRHRLTLEHLIEHFSQRKLHFIDKPTQNILRIGFYQLLFMDKVPDYAAVDESVRLAKETMGDKASGFVNAILRSFLRAAKKEDIAHETLDAQALYLNEKRTLFFTQEVLPDPQKYTVHHIAVCFSHPLWLVQRWLRAFGVARTVALCKADNEEPRVVLRTNILNTTRAELLHGLAEEEVDASEGVHPQAVLVKNVGDLTKLSSYRRGLFQVQDEAAMRVATAIEPKQEDRVLDVCASPGGKATHLAELMSNRGSVVANDISAEKIARVRENAQRLGIGILRGIVSDGTYLPLRCTFHKVLLDVPCSNTAVLARRADARWRLREVDIVELQAKQKKLLSEASRFVGKDGVLAYSTCSLEKEENESIVHDFLQSHPSFSLEKQEFVLPTAGHGGGFLALFRCL